MTTDILKPMEQRGSRKNKNITEYKIINTLIRAKIRKAKRIWLEEKCKGMEILQEQHDTHGVHKKLKETATVYRNSSAKLLMTTNEIVVKEEKKIKLSKTYVEDLFADDLRENIKNIESNSLNKTLS